MNLLTILLFFSAFSFTFFGISCFVAPSMKTEFIRYGLSKQRNTVGLLQIAGALGLVIGYFYFPLLVIITAICLSVLMILGFWIRIKIKDSVVQSAPSFFYALINTLIAIMQWSYLY